MSFDTRHNLTRRNFVKSSLAGIAILPARKTGVFDFNPLPDTAKVALVRTGDRKGGVAQALKLLDLTGVYGKRVILKPNFNSADETPASTHNDTLEQIVQEWNERGARNITLGESSGPRNTKRVMERKGIFDIANDLGFNIVNYDEIEDRDWVKFPELGTHWAGGFYLPRQAVNAEYYVSTCCLKTHGSGGVFTDVAVTRSRSHAEIDSRDRSQANHAQVAGYEKDDS